MDAAAVPGLTYLDRVSVRELMPDVTTQLDLVARTFVAMAHGRVENPPKIGVHPREAAFLHAMPAHLRDEDVTAVKWVAAYPGNSALGLPYISGLIVLSDSGTGLPVAVMDAAEITTARTAAVSGVSIRHLAHPGWQRVAILGYGAQGRQHEAMVRALHPGAAIRVFSPRLTGEVAGIEVCPDARTAADGADVVITAGPMSRDDRRRVERGWLQARALVLPVDFDAYLTADLVRAADDLVVDDVEQFEHYRSSGYFEGWPSPRRPLGTALESEPRGDLRICCSLGVGAVDAALADLVWRRARAAGIGLPLER